MKESNFENYLHLKTLLSIDGFGPRKILSLLARFKTFDKIINSNFSSLTSIQGLNELSANKLLKGLHEAEKIRPTAEKYFERVEKLNAKIITYFDNDYPALLKEIYNPPLILYIKGIITESDKNSIAVVGTRNPSSYGKLQAEKFVKELSSKEITVISGMARGIDSIAHSTALKFNGRTLAVIGSGLDVIYPPENQKLFYAISENGAIITEYDPGTKPDAVNFPKRNRLISDMSIGSGFSSASCTA